MPVILPLLVEQDVICQRLHITSTTLRRWEAKEVIPYHLVGKSRRYLEWEVEEALQTKHRFGPALPSHVGTAVLRERVKPEVIAEWLKIDRKTLERRMDDGIIPHYKIGQTYLFAPDEVLYSLGIPVPPPPTGVSTVATGGAP